MKTGGASVVDKLTKVELYPCDILLLSPLLLHLGDFNGSTKKSVVSLRRRTGHLKERPSLRRSKILKRADRFLT